MTRTIICPIPSHLRPTIVYARSRKGFDFSRTHGLLRIMRGAYLKPDRNRMRWEQRFIVSLARAVAAMQVLPSARCLTHTSAALVQGLAMWTQEPDVYLSFPSNPRTTTARLPLFRFPASGVPKPVERVEPDGRQVLLYRRRLDLDDDEIQVVGGVPVTRALRTAFACACDDMMQGVSFVIRGEDHVSNTPKQNWIRQSLGYEGEIKYAPLPIILNSKGKKMSKREDSSSVKWLLQSGYLPEAIANYLILLGNKTPREVFSMDEAVEFFDIAKISKSPAKFDEDKLAFINREHIKRASEQRLAELFELEPKFAPLIKFYTQEASLIPRIKEKIAAIYGAKDIPQEWAAQAQALREAILNLLSSNGAPMEFNDFKAALSQATNLKGKSLFMPLRFLLTGAPHGPELSELYPLIRADLKEILDATK